MSGTADFEALRRAMAENAGMPEGPARNARAEELLARAEALDVPLAVIEALGHQLKVYNYSSEKDKVFVPFARLLRLWDERPEEFDAHEAHSLHWAFKWVSAGMLGRPQVPLASIEQWLGEMERRHRIAGYTERAVRSAEFSVAAHVGDLARAERAYAAWLAADRDAMADCHACELHGQGGWQARCGRDAEALELWRPVLEGEYRCAHEPHTVLASSLLPLLRLGRVDEARAHHLRGLRLVRPMESMRGAYADHVEFCALTGNEARALELLAQRPAYFTATGEPRSLLDFMAVVTLLMDRLTGLGLGEQRVPGPPGREWNARELAVHARAQALDLAGRFDRRNATSRVGDRVRARMARTPLVERLALGVRTVHPAPAAVPAEPAPLPGKTDLSTLLAEARQLSDTLRPGALEAWAAVARAAADADAGLDARARAEITEHEAMAGGPESLALFDRAAELYAEAGDPGEALAARARGAHLGALAGPSPTAAAAATTVIAGLYDEVLALHAGELTGIRQTASVLISRARVLTHRVRGTAGPDGSAAGGAEALVAAERAVRELLALVGGRTGGDVRLAAREAEGRALLAEVAELGGRERRAARGYRQAADAYVAAGLPWCAVEYEVRAAALAHRLGDPGEAERALRSALAHGGPYVEPAGRARLHLQLAELAGGRDAAGEATGHALEAAYWADEAGESGTLGAWARQQSGGFLLRQGRYAEAAEVLESALPELSAETHGEGALVQAQWWLGDCLSELGEHRAAAERRLRAAEFARHWPEQQDHATLAHLAAESLSSAGLTAEADRAFARAGELWRSLGNPRFLVRSLRARAWLALPGAAGVRGARELMVSAVAECEDALGAAAEPSVRERLTEELGSTHRQFGDLLARAAAEAAETEDAGPAGDVAADATDADDTARGMLEAALTQFGRAAELFGTLGADGLDDRAGARLAAAELAAGLGRPAEAAAHARAVLAAQGNTAEGDDERGEEIRARRARAARLLRPER